MAANDDNDDGVSDSDGGTRIWLPPGTRRGGSRSGGTRARQSAPAGVFDAGAVIAGHFRVQAGPLGHGATGEAEVYRCEDTQSGETVAVKLYRPGCAPNQAVVEQRLGLFHPQVAALKKAVPWGERFIEVQEYCAGGTLAEYAPYTPEALTALLRPIIDALAFCHDQGIVHRDIKPTNLLYRDIEQHEIVLSDFGISSILDAREQQHGVRSTNTSNNFTLDYVAPEQLDHDQGTVGPKTDYYALGITLMHLLRGESPFAGMHDDEIQNAHRYNDIPYPTDIDESFHTLLRGLTQYDRTNRWGYAQVDTWARGEAVVDDQGRPWIDDTTGGPARPYPGYTQARTRRQLAAGLDHFNAENQLFRGDIRKWVFENYFGAALAERIEAIQEDYTARRELGVFKLRFVLDPAYPLSVADRHITSLDELAALLDSNEEQYLTALEDLLWGEYLETWIAGGMIAGERSHALARQIRETRQRLSQRNRRLALSTLADLLESRDFELAHDITLEHPGELEAALRGAEPDALPAIADTICSARFQEWWWATNPSNRDADLAHIQRWRAQIDTISSLDSDAELADFRGPLRLHLRYYALLAYFCPRMAFPFRENWLDEPAELIACARRPGDRVRAIALMRTGWLRLWLEHRQVAGSEALDTLFDAPELSDDARFQELLGLLDADLTPPAPVCETTTLDFGPVAPDQPKTRTVDIKQKDGGHLYGSVSLTQTNCGFTVEPLRIDGAPATLRVTANAIGLKPSARQYTTLRIQTNGGQLDIPLRYRVLPLNLRTIRRIAFGLIRLLVVAACLLAAVFVYVYFIYDDSYDFGRHDLQVPVSNSTSLPDAPSDKSFGPAEMKRFLNNHYTEWKLAHVSASTRHDCFRFGDAPNRPLTAVKGDFNGDGATDYAYELIADGKWLLTAFVTSPKRFYEIETNHAGVWVVPLSIMPKGASDYDYESEARVDFSNDAITINYCEKAAHTFEWNATDDNFRKLITSD